jgi:hypothetical protein
MMTSYVTRSMAHSESGGDGIGGEGCGDGGNGGGDRLAAGTGTQH